MPKAFSPTKSGSHRLVCRSLYRALLASCKTISPKTTSSSSTLSSHLQHLVKFRFRHDRKLQNPQQIRDSLDYGRRSLQLLQDASDGSKSALAGMTALLKGAHELATSLSVAKQHRDKDKAALPVHVQRKNAYIEMVRDPETYVSPKPGSIPITSRPVGLSRIKSKKRRVPTLVVTQGIPFLRYTRRQPYLLSMYLRKRIRLVERWWSLIEQMESMIPLAQQEDLWDRRVRQTFGIGQMDTDELGNSVLWASACVKAIRDLKLRFVDDERMRMRWGKKLYNIMVAERRLAIEESTTLKRAKRLRRTRNRER